MKNWLCLVFCTLFLLNVGCAALPDEETNNTTTADMATTTTTSAVPTTTTTTATTTTAAPTTTTTIAPAFISQERAVEIAQQHWGVRTGDRDPGTGFMMTVGPMELPTAETPEYVIALRWLVEDENGQVTHSSMVDRIRINAYTGAIVDPLQPE